MKKLLGIMVTSTLLLSACGHEKTEDNNKKVESKIENKGIKVVSRLDEGGWETITKIQDEETKCRYFIGQYGRLSPDLVQPKECKEKMESGE